MAQCDHGDSSVYLYILIWTIYRLNFRVYLLLNQFRAPRKDDHLNRTFVSPWLRGTGVEISIATDVRVNKGNCLAVPMVLCY